MATDEKTSTADDGKTSTRAGGCPPRGGNVTPAPAPAPGFTLPAPVWAFDRHAPAPVGTLITVELGLAGVHGATVPRRCAGGDGVTTGTRSTYESRVEPFFKDLVDGGVVLVKVRALERSPALAVECPILDASLPPHGVVRCSAREGAASLVGQAVMEDPGNEYGRVLKSALVLEAAGEFHGFDKVGLAVFAAWWHAHGALVGVRQGDVILWADGSSSPVDGSAPHPPEPDAPPAPPAPTAPPTGAAPTLRERWRALARRGRMVDAGTGCVFTGPDATDAVLLLLATTGGSPLGFPGGKTVARVASFTWADFLTSEHVTDDHPPAMGVSYLRSTLARVVAACPSPALAAHVPLSEDGEVCDELGAPLVLEGDGWAAWVACARDPEREGVF